MLSKEMQEWLATVKNDFPSFSQEIINMYQKPKKLNPTKHQSSSPAIKRPFHGGQHVSRVAAYIRVLVNFFKKVGYPQSIVELTEPEITLLQIVALLHDIGRKNDKGKDIYEKDSSEFCAKYLIEKGISREEALKVANIILYDEKDFSENTQRDDEKDFQKNIFSKLLQAADALDIMRVRTDFQLDKVSLYNIIKPEHQDLFIYLVRDIRNLIADQGDLSVACTVKNGEEIILESKRKTFSLEKKQKYEQAADCYSTVTRFKKHKLLNLFYCDNTSLNEELIINDSLFTPTDLVANKKFISFLKEHHYALDSDLYLKSVRPENHRNIASGAIQDPNNPAHFPLRPIDRKRFAVSADKIKDKFNYSTKQKSLEDNLYSQPQSFSLISANIQPEPFAFDSEQSRKLVGVIVPSKTIRLKRLFTKPVSSIARPYDASDMKAATKTKNKLLKRKILYSDLSLFKSRLEEKSRLDKSPSEVMVKIAWDDSCIAFVGSNTFEARALAINLGEIISKQQKLILKNSSQPHEVEKQKIYFYLPHSLQHMDEYTIDMQMKDKEEANRIFSDIALRHKKYKKKNYEFLLLLDERFILSALCEEIDGLTVIEHMLKNQYAHILESVLERSPVALSEKIQNIKLEDDIIPEILTASAKNNYPLVMDLMFKKIKNANANIPNKAKEIPFHQAIKNGHLELVEKMIINKNNAADPKQRDSEEHNALELAVMYNHSNIFKYLFMLDIEHTIATLPRILHLAMEYGRGTILQYLLDLEDNDFKNAISNILATDKSLCQSALKQGQAHVIKILIEDTRYTLDVNTALKSEEFQTLINCYTSEIAMSMSNSTGIGKSVPVINIFKDIISCIETESLLALDIFLANDEYRKAIKWLVNAQQDYDEENKQLYAGPFDIMYKKDEICLKLLQQGLINFSLTFFMKAARAGHIQTITYILDNPEIYTVQGSKLNENNVLQYILNNVCIGYMNSFSAYSQILQSILSIKDIDINAKGDESYKGDTALHIAVNNMRDVNETNALYIKFLLSQSNIDISLKNKDGKTPYDVLLKKINSYNKQCIEDAMWDDDDSVNEELLELAIDRINEENNLKASLQKLKLMFEKHGEQHTHDSQPAVIKFNNSK